MNRKKMRTSSPVVLVIKFLVAILLLTVTIGWITNFISHSVLSQTSNQSIKQNDMSAKEEIQILVCTLQDKNLTETSPEKIVKAIQQIDKLKSANVISAPDAISNSDVISALIDLLDFKMMKEKSNSSGVMSPLRLVTPDESYPAIQTLFIIGKPALPFLVKIIEEEKSESVKSENAFTTIKYIFREDLSKGIEFLEQARVNSTTAEGKLRLDKSIEKMTAIYLRLKN